jgi:hypothetical protein
MTDVPAPDQLQSFDSNAYAFEDDEDGSGG